MNRQRVLLQKNVFQNQNENPNRKLKPLINSKSFLSQKENLIQTKQSRMILTKSENLKLENDDLKNYVPNIIQHLRNSYQKNVPQENPLRGQRQINSLMKDILCNWLIEVHQELGLKTKTLFLAMNLIERFLVIRQVKQSEFQLLGITSLLIASKFEDIHPPLIEDLCYLCQNTYNKQQVLDLESLIISDLQFEFLFVSTTDVLEQFFTTMKINNEKIQQTCYLLAKVFLFQNYISKYNVYKLGAFILEESIKLHGIQTKLPFQVVTLQESQLLKEKLTKIIRKKFQQPQVNSIQKNYPDFYAKLNKSY